MADDSAEVTGGNGPGNKPASVGQLALVGLFVATVLAGLLVAIHHYWPRCEPFICERNEQNPCLAQDAGTSLALATTTKNWDGGTSTPAQPSPRSVDAATLAPDGSVDEWRDGGDEKKPADPATTALAPTITKLTPPAGSTCGCSPVTIEGTGFSRGPVRLTFGGLPAQVEEGSDENTIFAHLPPHWEATVDVVVRVGGNTATLTKAFNYVCPDRTQNRLLLLVMLAGALGGALHALRSLYDFVGRRLLLASWLAMYLSLPFCGAALSTVFFLVFMAGFYSPDSSDDSNFFMMVGVSALVGMFSPQAVEKLKKISEAILTTAPAAPDKAAPERVTLSLREATPKQIAGKQNVTIRGTAFVEGMTVLIGGTRAANVRLMSSSELVVEAPDHAPGIVDIEVQDTNGNRAALPGAITYIA